MTNLPPFCAPWCACCRVSDSIGALRWAASPPGPHASAQPRHAAPAAPGQALDWGCVNVNWTLAAVLLMGSCPGGGAVGWKHCASLPPARLPGWLPPPTHPPAQHPRCRRCPRWQRGSRPLDSLGPRCCRWPLWRPVTTSTCSEWPPAGPPWPAASWRTLYQQCWWVCVSLW